MAALSLKKGNSLQLVKADKSPLTKVRVELNWNPNTSNGEFDLDVISACTDDNLKAVDNSEICFFNQRHTTAITVSEDNRTGADAADGSPDETLWIDLSKVPANATKLPIIVTIYDAESRCQSFADISGTSVKLFNDETNELLAECSIAEIATSKDISLLFAVMERDGTGFKWVQTNNLFSKSLEQWFELLQ